MISVLVFVGLAHGGRPDQPLAKPAIFQVFA